MIETKNIFLKKMFLFLIDSRFYFYSVYRAPEDYEIHLFDRARNITTDMIIT